MTSIPASPREIPLALQRSLAVFRTQVRRRKVAEVALLAACGFLLSFLAVFALDRWIDTPGWLRLALLLGGTLGFGLLLPFQLYRWVWGTRRFDQVARVIAKKDLATGDRLLGVIDLTHNDTEYGRSPVLCRAAIDQVDAEFEGRDQSRALPDSRHRAWARAAVPMLAITVAAFAIVPDAANNAARRWLSPFGSTPRFTFARMQALPATMVVAKGEPGELRVALAADTDWRPGEAIARGDAPKDLVAALEPDGYRFALPPLTRAETLDLRIGDFRHRIAIEPVDRPAIATLDASVQLPEYLGIPKPRTLDGRAGVVGVVKGSRVELVATTTRELQRVTGNGEALAVRGAGFTVPAMLAESGREIVLDWTDVHGLHGVQPMTVGLRVHDDELPAVYSEGLRNETVLLVSDTLTFQVHAHDDFGVRRMGLSWETIPDPLASPKPVKGEKLLVAAADGEQADLAAEAVFCPELLKVPAEPIKLSAWCEDACPGHARACSVAMTVYVMTPEQHMIWLTKQLTAWDDEAREVHERELALHDENLALRGLSAEELDKPSNRRRLEMQARGERSNSQRLSGLLTTGKSLLSQAARNPEFNATMLDQWAEMMSALQDIAASRMPSVANLLAAAASSRSSPSAGVSRLGPAGGAPPPTVNVNKLPGNPSVVDAESTMITNPGAGAVNQKGGKVNQAPAPLRLAGTTLQGKTCAAGDQKANGEDDDPDKVDTISEAELAKAIEEQKKLLAEFARLQGDIGKVIAALTGSTFVKRLKAESREQGSITAVIRDGLLEGFGERQTVVPGQGGSGRMAEAVVGREGRASTQVSLIQDDLGAFVDRLDGQPDQKKFKTVLDEMRSESPSVEIADVGNDVKANLKGDAVMGTEFWADRLDYWAELLVGPG